MLHFKLTVLAGGVRRLLGKMPIFSNLQRVRKQAQQKMIQYAPFFYVAHLMQQTPHCLGFVRTQRGFF